MNELDEIINRLVKEKGGSRSDYRNLLNTISYHESAGTQDPKIKQFSGGPGRGKYQFEEGKNQGGITAARRTKQYYKDSNIPVPTWLEKANKNNSLDATSLSSQQQDILFLGNMRKHPKANFSNVWEGKESITDFWSKYHWAGAAKDRPARERSFNSSTDEYNSKTNRTRPSLNVNKDVPRESVVREVDKTRVDTPQAPKEFTKGKDAPKINAVGNYDYMGSIMTMANKLDSKTRRNSDTIAEPPKPDTFKQVMSAQGKEFSNLWNSPKQFLKDFSGRLFSGDYQTEYMEGQIKKQQDYQEYQGKVKEQDSLDAASSKQFADGGLTFNLYTGDQGQLNEFHGGGTHDQNPLGGIPQGKGNNGQMNTVEDDETSFESEEGKYIFSARLGLYSNK